MSNKKGGVASDQIGGALAFMIGITFLIMIIFIYYAFDSKKSIAESDLSVAELNTIEALNFFLDLSVDSDRKVRDLIKESYINNDYQKLAIVADQYLSRKYDNWKLIFFDQDDYYLFETQKFNRVKNGDIAESKAEVLVALPESQEFYKIRVILQTY